MTKARDLANASTALSAVSATELAFVDGVTSAIQTQMDAKLATATAATTYQAINTNVSTTELGYLDGVTSAVQTQLNQKPEFVAGKNKIINGDFGIWQRGTSFSTSGVYTADRFLTNTDATFTLTQQTFTPGAAPIAGYEGQYFLRWAKSAGGSYLDLAQRIEDVRTFAGQTITLSFWAKVSSGTASVEPYYVQDFGTGGSGAVAGALTAQTINTSWARYSFNLAVPSVTGKTIGTSSRLQISPLRILTSGAVTADIWGVQVEAGSVATPFQTATGTLQGELAACQRYFLGLSSALNVYTNFGVGVYATSTIAQIMVPLPVTMRVQPSISVGTVGNYSVDGVTGNACSNLTAGQLGNQMIGLSATTAASTTGYGCYLRASNTASALIQISAEL